MLDIPYINAMIIYRTYKSDNKIISHAKQHKTTDGHPCDRDDSQLSMEEMRAQTIKVLLKAIDDNVFSDKEVKKIVAISPELLLQTSSLGIEGYDFE